MRFAIIEAIVPSSTETVPFEVDYTHPDITDFDVDNHALAFILSGGDVNDEDGHGSISYATIAAPASSGTGEHMIAAQAATGRTINLADRQQAAFTSESVLIHGNALSGADAFRARADLVTRLTNGIRLKWTELDGVTGGREYRIVIAFAWGSDLKAEGYNGGTDATTGFGGVHAVLHQNRGTALGSSLANHAFVGLGGAVDDGALKQASSCIAIRGGTATAAQAFGHARDDAFCLSLNGTGTGSPPTPSNPLAAAVTAFNATDVTEANILGNPGRAGVYLHSSRYGAADFGVALEALDGSGGEQHFTGLGIPAGLVIGMISGVTAEATVQDSSARAFAAIFVTTGAVTRCFSFSSTVGVTIGAGVPTAGFSRLSSNLSVLDHVGGTVFEAEVLELTRHGIRLNVSTGLAGRMFLFGFSAEPGKSPTAPRGALAGARGDHIARRVAPLGRAPASLPAFPWRELARQRHAVDALFLRRGQPAPRPVSVAQDVVPFLEAGDSALSGSAEGSSALAGSVEGDSG